MLIQSNKRYVKGRDLLIHSFMWLLFPSLAVTVLDWLDHQIYSAYNRNTHTPSIYVLSTSYYIPRLCTSALPKPGFGIPTLWQKHFLPKLKIRGRLNGQMVLRNNPKSCPKKSFKKLSSKNSRPKRFSKKKLSNSQPTKVVKKSGGSEL